MIKPATVTIAPESASVVVTKTLQLVATVRDASGNPIPGETVTWSSENSTIASVSATGLVTAGTTLDSTRIKAMSGNKVAGYARIRVIRPPVATVTVAPDTTITVGDATTMRVTLRDADGNVLSGRAVMWSSARPAVASVHASSGLVNALADDEGTSVAITATSEGISGFATVGVRAAATAIAVAPSAGTYLGTATISVTLTSRGAPVANRPVVVGLFGVSQPAATTDASGSVTLTLPLGDAAAGSYPASNVPAPVSASFAGDATFAPSSGAGSLEIARAAQTITFGPLSSRTMGEAPFTVQATTTAAGLAVTFTAEGACTLSADLVEIVAAGTCTITASQAGNTNYLPAESVAQAFTIAQGSQTITFAALPSRAFGDAPFAVSANASSGLPVSFSATGSCSITGTTITLSGSGTCTVTASQSGNSSWLAAADVVRSFAITKANATIDLAALSHVYDGSPKSAVATTTPAGLQTLTIRYNGSTVPPTDAGSYAVEATLDNADYEAAPATGTLTIARAAQTVTFDALTDRTFGDEPFTLVASASSGLPVSFSASGACAVAGSTVTINSAGSCTVIAEQTGNANYLAAPSVSRSFTVASRATTLQVATASGSFGGSVTLNATLSAGGSPLADRTIAFALNGTPVGSATTNSAGAATLTASLAGIPAGYYTSGIGASFEGDANHEGAWVSSMLSVGQGNATLSLSGLSQTYDGTARAVSAATQPEGLSGVTVMYDGQPIPPVNAGSYSVTATLENPNYNAEPVSGTLLVAKATPVIAWPMTQVLTYGTPLGAEQLNATASFDGAPLAGSLVYSHAAGAILPVGIHPISASFTPADEANFVSASLTRSVIINQATQTIAFEPLPNRTFGDAPFALTATASSGLPVSFEAFGECTVTGSLVTITSAGGCRIHATQPGDANYQSAPLVDHYFAIAAAATAVDVASVTATYGGTATLSATLTRSGWPLAGRTISFTIAGMSAGSAVTDAAGVAMLDAAIGGDAGTYPGAIVATFAGERDHAASSSSSTLIVNPATVTLTLSALTQEYSGVARSVVVSTSPSVTGVVVTYDGSATPPVNAGSYAVVATLSNPNYVAEPASGTLEITKAVPTLDWSTPAPITYGTALGSTQLNATASHNGTSLPGQFVYTPAAGTVPGGGSHPLTAAFQPNDAGNYASGTVSTTITVAPAWQYISFAWPGNRGFEPRTFEVTATASSGLPVSFSAVGNCEMASVTTVMISADTGGTCSVIASQSGNADWLAARPDTQTFAIARSVTSVTISPDPIIISADGNLTIQAVVRGGSDGAILTDRRVTWLSTNTAVMIAAGDTMTGTGLIVGRSPGQAQVIATSEGRADTVDVFVNPAGITHRWLGTSSSSWDDPANWWYDPSNSGRTPVPSRDIDFVYVPQSTPNSPQLSSSVVIRNLLLENQLSLNSHRLRLAGRLDVASTGMLVIQQETDTLVVDGESNFGGYVAQYGGVILLRGNFRQIANPQRSSFAPMGGKAVFAGTAPQTITFDGSGESYFTNLEITNASAPVTFTGDMLLRGDLVIRPMATLSGTQVTIRGGGLPDVEGSYAVATTVLQTDVTLSGNRSLSGTLVIDGARLTLGGHKLSVDDLTVRPGLSGGPSGPVLQFDADTLAISDDATFEGFVEMYAGAITIGGDFHQVATSRHDSFAPMGGTVIFNGSAPQSIRFDHISASHFHDVVIANFAAPVSFASSTGGIMTARGRVTVLPMATLAGPELWIRGGALPRVDGTYDVATTSLQTDVTLNQSTRLTSKLVMDGARVALNGHTLTVRDLEVRGNAWGGPSGPQLINANDSLVVERNAEFAGFVEQYAGTILIGGNFVQSDAQRFDSFAPMGGTVVFNGTTPQTIRFGNNQSSWFNNVVIANMAAPVSFATSANGVITTRGQVTVLPMATLAGPDLWIRGGQLPVVDGTYDVARTTLQTDVTLARSSRLPSTLVLDGARLSLNGNRLTVSNLIVNANIYGGASGPHLINASDTLIIENNAEFGGFVEQYAGTIMIGGDFVQSSTNRFDSFAPMGGTVVFNGTRPQSIQFTSPMYSYFTDLVIANVAAPVSIASTSAGAMMARGQVTVLPFATLTGTDLWIRGGPLPAIHGTYAVATTTLQTDVTLSGNVSLPSNLVIEGGRLTLNGHKLTVGGNLSVRSSPYGMTGPHMSNESDTLLVEGNAEFDGFVEQYAGAIVLRGNFTQSATSRMDSFSPMGGIVIFSGSIPQTVSFASPGPSAFATLQIGPGANVTLATAARIRGQLIAGGGTLTGNGNRLDVTGGLRIQGFTIDNTDFVVDGGTLSQFDYVRFTGYAPSAPYQMAISNNGTFAMNNITFHGTPDAGNVWIRADVNPAGGSGTFDLAITVPSGCAPGYSSGTATVAFTFVTCGGTVAGP